MIQCAPAVHDAAAHRRRMTVRKARQAYPADRPGSGLGHPRQICWRHVQSRAPLPEGSALLLPSSAPDPLSWRSDETT